MFVGLEIGNGQSTKLWLDSWHPKGVLIVRFRERIRYDAGSRRDTLVASLLANDEWRTGPTTSHDVMEAWGALPSIERLHITENDQVVWRATPQGVFSTKTAWEIIRTQAPRVDWHETVWFTHHIPKHSFLAWRVMSRRPYSKPAMQT